MVQTPYPRPRYANYLLGVLLAAYILSFIDRNILAILVGPIREEFAISDFQFSILHGWSFTLLYVVLGVPFGWLVDRSSRRWIVIGGVVVWSVMTCLCGVARSFSTLFLTRVGVGVGEASLSPAAYSMLSDVFPPHRLPWATSIFAMGITLGTGISFMVGGVLYDFFSHSETLAVIAPAMRPWQATFMTVGLLGFVVVALLWPVREPMRHRHPDEIAQAEGGASLGEVMAYMWQRRRLYGSLMFAVGTIALAGYGCTAWYPEFLVRSHGMSKTQAGSAVGLVFMVVGTLGSFAGAVFAALLRRRGYLDANLRWVMLAAALMVVPSVFSPLMPGSTGVIVLFAIVVFLQISHFGVAMAALQLVTPSRMRGQTTAIVLFFINLLGLGVGASVVASLTDFVFGDDLALRYSLAITGGVFYLLAAVLGASGLASYRRAVAVG